MEFEELRKFMGEYCRGCEKALGCYEAISCLENGYKKVYEVTGIPRTGVGYLSDYEIEQLIKEQRLELGEKDVND